MRAGVVIAVVVAALLAAGAGTARADLPTPDRATFLKAAEDGVAKVDQLWWVPSAGWYKDFLFDPFNPMPLARLWSAFPLFETLDALAVADPTDANEQALRTFADRAATLYWDPNVPPDGAFGWYPDNPSPLAYFDDTGWWGLCFVDAYRALGDPKYLDVADKALRSIMASGWDPQAGGVWWETGHQYKTIEPLAAAFLTASYLYEVRHDVWYLQQAQKLLDWANHHSWNAQRGLYQRSDTSDTVMDYVQGLMISGQLDLCRALGRLDYCAKAQRLGDAALAAFPQDLDWGPQFDVVYLRWMLDVYAQTGDRRWYDLAYRNGQRALASVDQRGLYTQNWDGKWLADGLEEDAASLELFAWLAAVPAPG